jgi:hypothetical protein
VKGKKWKVIRRSRRPTVSPGGPINCPRALHQSGTVFHLSPITVSLFTSYPLLAQGIDDIPSRISNVIKVATNDYAMGRIAVRFRWNVP